MCTITNISEKLIIKNQLGLHARAAAKLVKAAEKYQSEIRLVKNGTAADARSLLSLISLGCAYDSVVTIEAHGEDAHQAIQDLSAIIIDRFGEG